MKLRAKPRIRIRYLEVSIAFLTVLFMYLATRIESHGHATDTRPIPSVQSGSATWQQQPALSYADYSSNSTNFQLDIVSIGSLSRLDYQQTQQTLFGSHPAVRFFFNITELDDDDPHCATSLGREGAMTVSHFCVSKRRWGPRQFVMKYLKHCYSTEKWLAKKENPQGWMCAQTRPTFGFHRAIQQYRQAKSLPDYLIVMDDDTYLNVDLVQEYLLTIDRDIPRAIAGCMIRSPIGDINFTIPFGGYGMIFSRAALFNYMRPIYCEGRDQDGFTVSACYRLRDNQLGEQYLFQDGMSVADIQRRYASFQPYANYRNWSKGFCLHSDWVWGFFSNFYNISKHVDDPFYADVQQARMDGYMGSELYAGKRGRQNDLLGICKNEGAECNESSHICHYQSPDDMKRLVALTK